MSTVEGLREPPSQDYGAAIARLYQDTTVAGAGFRVSEHYILTCAHVVSQCLGLGKKAEGISATQVEGKTLEIDFPVDESGRRETVEVIPELWRIGEDIAGLRLIRPVPVSRAVTLERDSKYWNHPFAVYGFPKNRSDGRWIDGKLLEKQPGTGRVQIEGTRSEGLGVSPGFSGSPVWDMTYKGVVGMVVARDTEELAKIGFMIPYEKLKPTLEAIALFELLLPEADSLAPHWRNAYRLVRPEISTESQPSTLEAAILQVQEMGGQDSGYRAIDRFIGYLALPQWGLNVRHGLIKWLHNRGIKARILLAAIQQAAKQQAEQPAGLDPHLLVWVQTEWNSDRYSAKAYLIPNRDQYDPAATGIRPFQDLESAGSPEQLEEFLQICIDESVRELPQQEPGLPPLQVEVFLPRQYLRWEIDQWRVQKKSGSIPKPKSVSSRYSVVLRCADRLDKNYCDAQMQILWRQKWSTSNSMNGNAAAQRLTSGHHPDGCSLYDHLEPAQIMGWHRLQPPPPSVAEDEACHFSVLLGAGAFVAIWVRQSLQNAEQEMTQLLGSCLSELPARVSELRKAAAQSPDKTSPHIGEQISLIWDDPKLVPPIAPIVSRFRMSA